MAVAAPEAVPVKPVHEFDGVYDVWPRGDRPRAIRERATAFRERFARPDNRIRAVRTVPLASAAYPLTFAFHGAARGLNPFINIVNKLVIVQFEDFEGTIRTLAWEPTIAEGAAEAPFYDQLLKRYGEFLSYKVFATFYNTVEEAVAVAGITPADVDYVSFDHLHVQDLRLTMVHADHSCGILDDGKIIYGGEAVGYVIEFSGGFKIYHAGDTNLFGDMKLIGELYRPDLAMLPIGDLFTMSPREAAYACQLLGIKKVIPMHFGTFPPLTGTPQQLMELTGRLKGLEILGMKPGETITI